MSADQIANTLADHQPYIGPNNKNVMRAICLATGCQWTHDAFGDMEEAHTTHQAAVLAPLIEAREQEAAKVAKRKAWDECDSLWRIAYPLDHSTTNPYRARAGGES